MSLTYQGARVVSIQPPEAVPGASNDDWSWVAVELDFHDEATGAYPTLAVRVSVPTLSYSTLADVRQSALAKASQVIQSAGSHFAESTD